MNILPNLYRYPYVCIWGFPGGSDDKESACNSGDLGSIPGSGRSPGEGNGNPPQFSCLENPHGQRSLVGCSPWDHKELDTTEWLTLSLFHIYIIYISYISYIYIIYISYIYIPAVQETWVLSWVRKILWKTEWQPTPVFLPGEFHEQRNLADYSLRTKSWTRLSN